jgi:hypothetical protein
MPKGYPRPKIDPDADLIEAPTVAEVARWKSGLSKIQARIKGLSARADQYIALIAAAEPMAPARQMTAVKAPKSPRIKVAAKAKKGRPKKVKPPAEDAPQLPLKRRKQRKGATWTSVIHTILTEAGRGLLHTELRAEVVKTDLAERLSKSDKGFYGGIAKLADQKPPLLIKHKGRLFAPATYHRFMADVAAGRVPDLEDIQHIGNASPFRDAILDLMKRFDDGATSAEIIQGLRQNPALVGTLQRHQTHVYNVLSRLVEREELTKSNGKYVLGPKQQAA